MKDKGSPTGFLRYRFGAQITMIVTLPDSLQLSAKVISQVSSTHLWPMHLPLPWRLSPTTARVLVASHLLLPSRFPVPNRMQRVTLQRVTQTSRQHPAPPPFTLTLQPPQTWFQNLLLVLLGVWFNFIVTHVPSCNTPKDSSVNSQDRRYFFFFSLSWKREKGYQRQRFPRQMHCLSALCNRALDIGSAPDNTWIDFPSHTWKVLGLTHLSTHQLLLCCECRYNINKLWPSLEKYPSMLSRSDCDWKYL